MKRERRILSILQEICVLAAAIFFSADQSNYSFMFRLHMIFTVMRRACASELVVRSLPFPHRLATYSDELTVNFVKGSL